MAKIIITVNGGCVSINEKPDDVEIEIRDYDIEGADGFPEERPDCKKDGEGDWYQEIIFPAK